GLKPVGEVGIVADRCLPDGGDEAEAVQRVATIKMDCSGIHHLAAACDNSKVAHRLDGTDAEPAVELAFEALAPRGEKVAGPAIQADAVDEVRRALGRLEIVLAAGIVRIADAAVTVAMIDAVLAPDLALADVNSLLRGEIALAVCIEKARDQRLRAISIADHSGDQAQRLVNGLLVVLARVVHRCEIAARDEGDLVSVAVVIGGQQPPGIFVLLAIVV